MHLHLEDMATYVDANRRREAERRRAAAQERPTRLRAPASATCSPGATGIGRWRGAGPASTTIVSRGQTTGRVDAAAAGHVPVSFAASDRSADQPRPTARGRGPVL